MESFDYTLFGRHLILAFSGLILFSLVAIKDNIRRFNIKIFWHDNKPFWIWASILQVLFAALMVGFPDVGTSLKTISGLDLSEPMAFFTSGVGLAGLANWTMGVGNSERSIGSKGKP